MIICDKCEEQMIEILDIITLCTPTGDIIKHICKSCAIKFNALTVKVKYNFFNVEQIKGN